MKAFVGYMTPLLGPSRLNQGAQEFGRSDRQQKGILRFRSLRGHTEIANFECGVDSGRTEDERETK